jgi:hypothetical protein
LLILKRSAKVLDVLNQPDIAIVKNNMGWGNDASLTEFRLNRSEKVESIKSSFRSIIASALLENPPYEFLWLLNHPLREKILNFISSTSLNDKFSTIITRELTGRKRKRNGNFYDEYFMDKKHVDDLLALRGLLTHNIFFHCLQKRHRVEYGVRRTKTTSEIQKRMAVPFRASDTPADRTEYSHPDMAITLTCLSYCFDGLSRLEFDQAIRNLLMLEESVKDKIYHSWFELSDPSLTANVANKINKCLKIDTSNLSLMTLMYETYRKNMLTVFFWLNYCVFPLETAHFPHKIIATPWTKESASQERMTIICCCHCM